MSSKEKLKCVACGHNIYKTDTILGLMPRGQITELKRKQCKFYTNNDIKFVWQKIIGLRVKLDVMDVLLILIVGINLKIN